MSALAGRQATKSERAAYLLDANILLRRSDAASAQHLVTRRALAMLASEGARLHIVAQSLFEFWAVATRPTGANGLGLTITEAAHHIVVFQATFEYLPEAPLLAQWQRLITTYGVSGKTTHDARYVAAMRVHGIKHILTFNGADFTRYATGEGSTIVDPATLAAVPVTPPP